MVAQGHLVARRRHANGLTAAVLKAPDGTFTARRWPPTTPLVTGLQSRQDAQVIADHIAHEQCAGISCGPWCDEE